MDEGESVGEIDFNSPLKALQAHFCRTIHFPDQILLLLTPLREDPNFNQKKIRSLFFIENTLLGSSTGDGDGTVCQSRRKYKKKEEGTFKPNDDIVSHN